MESLGKVGTAGKYRYCLNLLSQCNSVTIRFEQIDMGYLREFEAYLLGKDNASNSVATKFSVFKAVYNRAIADGVFEPKDNPFNRFKVGKYWKPTRKRAICKEDILKLKALELPDGGSFYLEFARDIFLFSYYVAGINFKDIATLKWRDIEGGRIYYQRHKTGKEMSCHLMHEAQQIMEKYGSPFYDDDDYIFPILNGRTHTTEQQIFNRVHKMLIRVNGGLKQISKMIGLKMPLTTYVARHTYATVLKRSGVNVALISESLGHSDLATTQIYLDSFENSQLDEAMKNLL
jgi:site-specific recombinase XerD